MKLVPVNLADISKNLTYNRGRNQKIIEEFIASGLEAAEITEYPQAQSSSCSNSLTFAIKSLKVPQVQARVINKRVYLIRTDKLETTKEN